MSEAEAVEKEEETDEQPADPETETEEQPDDERPELDDDEKATLDLDGVDLDAVDDAGNEAADDVADETDEDSDEADDEGNESDGDDDGDSGDVGAPGWGDMYVDVLVTLLGAVVDEYGDDDGDGIDPEEIEALANQPPVALNEQADRVFAEMTGAEELPPGQALVIGTATVCGTVILKETDVAQDALGEVAEKARGGPA